MLRPLPCTTSVVYLLLLLLLLTLPHCVPSTPLPCPATCACVGSAVKCTYQQLSGVPGGIPPDTTSLDLSHNRLRDDSWDQLLSAVDELSSLKQLILTDNILTTIPANGLPNIKLDLAENPLHCDCSTYALPPTQFTYPGQVRCATTSNPDVQDVYLTSLSRTLLNCEAEKLIVPADITLYKISSEQIIPCHKSKPGTVYWIKRGVLKYQTEKEDCSLVLKFITSKDEGLYQVKYEAPFESQTTFINVMLLRESSKPHIDVSTPLLEVQRKGTAKLTCKASGAPPPSIEWFYHNKSVSLIKDNNIVRVDNATLIITDITREEVFTCRATNLLGTSEAKFVVKTVDKMRGAVFEWLAPLSVALLIVTGAGSVGYFFYSKQKLARLKQRCSSPGVSSVTGTVFENCEALPSTITQCEGYKMLAISTSSPPHQLICPITRECMKNPVVASDGFSYEEKAILAWFKRNGTSPMTNGEISKRLIQNHNLRTLIRDIMDKTSISDSFINVENVSPSTSARSSNPRVKVVTSPSHSRLSRVAPDDTSPETANISPTSSRPSSTVNNTTASRYSVNTNPSTARFPDTAGPSSSRPPNSHPAAASLRSSTTAAEVSNVSTRDRRFMSDGSSTSGTTPSSSSSDHGIGTSVSDQAHDSESGTSGIEPHTLSTDNQTTDWDNTGSGAAISISSSLDSPRTDGPSGDEISLSHV